MIVFLTSNAWKQFGPHRTLVQAVREMGAEIKVLSPSQISVEVSAGTIRFHTNDGRGLSPSLVFHRLRRPPGCEILYLFEDAGIRVVNPPGAWRVCYDKTLQAGAFAKHAIPHPKTVFAPAQDGASLRALVSTLEEWVVKPVHGRGGLGVRFLVESERIGRFLENPAAYLKRRDAGPFLVQSFITHPQEPRHHIRCHVVGGMAVSAGMLLAPPGRYLTNRAQGGTWRALEEIPPVIASLSEGAALAIGLDYTGVDLACDEAGSWWVLECNNMPDLRQPLINRLAVFLVDQAKPSKS